MSFDLSAVNSRINAFELAPSANRQQLNEAIKSAAQDGQVSQQEIANVARFTSTSREQISSLLSNIAEEVNNSFLNNTTMPRASRVENAQSFLNQILDGDSVGMGGGRRGHGASRTPEERAARTIGACYRNNETTPSYTLNGRDQESRLADLRQLTQRDNITGNSAGLAMNDNVRCGAAALVGAAYYANGGTGVNVLWNSLIDFTGHQLDRSSVSTNLLGSDLGRKINRGENSFNSEEMSIIQDAVYKLLNDWETAHPISAGANNTEGLNSSTMHQFINSRYCINGFGKLLSDNGVSFRNIDNDGDRSINHFVVFVANPNQESGIGSTSNPAVYDPWPRTGGQVVTGEGVEVYRRTNFETVRVNDSLYK